MAWKALWDDEAVGAGSSSAKALVDGRKQVAFLVQFTTLGGGTLEPWIVARTPDGDIEAQPYTYDPTAGAFRLSNVTLKGAYNNLLIGGARLLFFKLVGGTGATGLSVIVESQLETS